MDTNKEYKYLEKDMLKRFVAYLKASFGTVKFVNGKRPDNKGNVNVDTTTDAINRIYPVGAIYITLAKVNPGSTNSLGVGTWELIDGGTGGYTLTTTGSSATPALPGTNAATRRASSVGSNSLKLEKNNLPSHTHTINVDSASTIVTKETNAAGDHTHTRGTMNITGLFGADDRMCYTINGAFYTAGGSDTGSSGTGGGYKIAFDASRTWDGETSVSGSHTHTIDVANLLNSVTIESSGSAEPTDINITPLSLPVYIWVRVK